MSREPPVDRFTVELDVTIRRCTEADLPALEWFGVYHEHRDIIRQAFAQQREGTGLILLADVMGFPVGQVWIDFERHSHEGAAFLWALRVFPFLRARGIAGRLIAAAEDSIAEAGFTFADISLERSELGVQPFYERRGFRVLGTIRDRRRYTTPQGNVRWMDTEQIVLRKPLRTAAPRRSAR